MVPDWPTRIRSSATTFSRGERKVAVAGELGKKSTTRTPTTKASPPKR
jgi:hypothetical protein